MNNKISITKTPFFHNLLHTFIKENIDLNSTLDFLAENIKVTGYCPCNQLGCATIYLEAKTSLTHYKKTHVFSKNSKIQRLHFNSNDILKEFKYIDRNPIDTIQFKKRNNQYI
uniref:hypothetical protein n=1 Tax=Aliarcobacter sp. TaxID=2321116 RepID=UPI0040487546